MSNSFKCSLEHKIIKTNLFSYKKIFSDKGKIYTFLNPVSYLQALDNKKIFESFDGLFADGSILVFAIKLLYGKIISRKSFDMTSIAQNVLEYAEKNNSSIFIIASKQEQVETAVNNILKRYPKIRIIGYRNGYFNSEEEKQSEAIKIVKLNPYFLLVGMGTLLQESFLLKVKSLGYKGIGFTCGGFIHQISKNEIDYYPKWINLINLRFMYRMYKEKHTRKRYFQAALEFPVRFIYERFRF